MRIAHREAKLSCLVMHGTGSYLHSYGIQNKVYHLRVGSGGGGSSSLGLKLLLHLKVVCVQATLRLALALPSAAALAGV